MDYTRFHAGEQLKNISSTRTHNSCYIYRRIDGQVLSQLTLNIFKLRNLNTYGSLAEHSLF